MHRVQTIEELQQAQFAKDPALDPPSQEPVRIPLELDKPGDLSVGCSANWRQQRMENLHRGGMVVTGHHGRVPRGKRHSIRCGCEQKQPILRRHLEPPLSKDCHDAEWFSTTIGVRL